MKRFISLVLTLLLLMTSVNVVVFAVTEKTFDAAKDIYSTTAGEGFYDNRSAGGREGLEKDGKSVVLRQKEWICYDVSDFESGVYTLSINRGMKYDLTASVLLDDAEVIGETSIAKTGDYSATADFVFGNITFSGSQKKLKIKNTSSNRAMYINTITLKKLDPLSVESFTSNADAGSGLIGRGADVFTITMSTDVVSGTATDKTVMIKKGENALKADVKASGKVITLKLKESLDFSSEYTLYISGVSATNGQTIENPVSVPFNTADATVVTGTAYIEVTSFEAKDGTVTASGYVKSSAMLGISGREVSLYTKGEKEAEESFGISATSGEDGAFNLIYTMPESSDAGKHEVIITSDYVTDAYTDSILYFSKALGEDIKKNFSNLSDTDDVLAAVDEYKDYLGVDMVWAGDTIADFDKVYDKLLNKSFDDASAVINTFKEAVYFEAIVQTDDADEIVAILDDETKNEYIKGFNTSLWNVLGDAEKTAIAEKTTDLIPSDTEDLADSLNSEVKAQLIVKLGLDGAELSFSSDEIMTGDTAEITASIDNAVSDVVGIHFEFLYDDENAELFEADGIIVEAPNGMDYVTEAKDNVLSIDLKADETISVSGDFMTVKIPASGRAGGTHMPLVSGYIVYRPAAIADADENLSVDFKVASNPVITVNVVKSMSFKAPDVINRIEGEGFHDEPSLGGTPGLDVSGSSVIYRNGEWGVYDISALAEGKYEVSVYFSSNAGTTFAFDAEGKIVSKTLPTTGGYGTYITEVIGIIEVSGLQKTLKFINNGPGASYVVTISLERVEMPAITEVTTNAGISDDVVPRGADRFNITYNNVLDAKSIADGKVTIQDKDGKVIPLEAIISNKTVTVDLKETLGYDKEYTIKINGIKDKYGQNILNDIIIKTDGLSNTNGASSVKIDTWKVSGKEFIAEGKILSSSGTGIKGRKIKLTAKAPDGAEYVLWKEAESGENGVFSISYTFDESCVSGKYALVLEYEYAKSAYKNNAYYFDDELSAELGEEFSNLASEAEVLEKLNEYSSEMGINLDVIQEDIDISYITNKMANKVYESAGEVIDEINKRYALEKVNKAIVEVDKETVLALVDSVDALKEIGEIQREKWNALEDEKQLEVAQSLVSDGRIEEPLKLIEKIDELINGILKAEYDIAGAVVSVSASDVNVGQSASFTFAATEKQENVVDICIEIEYTEDEANLFEGAVSYTLSKDLKDLSVNKTTENGKLKFVLTVPQNKKNEINKVSFRDDIITLSFKATADAVGDYNPKVSGYITYHADELDTHQTEAYFVDVPFETEENPSITVNAVKESGNKDYNGGGGASGGKNYGTQTSGNASIPSTTDEGLLSESAFSDLDSVSWAKDSIEALALKGIVNGRGDGTFAPNDSVTRGEFCKMITSAFGVVKNDAVCEFSDVDSSSWFYIYVASAKNAGLVNGKTETNFAPLDTITREEMAAIALRALGETDGTDNVKFADDEEISQYAKDAVYKLKKLGILDGVGDNMFAPREVVTRAMAAKVIYALMMV